jgi:5-formyltetrahydrofolate cyclo-ligase
MRIGVAYGVQKADALPMTRLDVPLHGIVTETGLFTCTT